MTSAGRMLRTALGIALLLPLVLCSGATTTWKGAANGDWFVAGNWTALAVPADGDDVVVTNTSILLTNATAGLGSFTITNATVTFTNWITALNATNVLIRNNGTLTHGVCTSTNAMTNRVWIIASNVTIETGGRIDVTGKGYSAGPGAAVGQRNGSGYGGLGGYREGDAGGRLPYGSPWAPTDPGSGRATTQRGGGAVRIEASGHVLVNGWIKANGQEYAGGYAGEGSGGGVYITCRTFGGTNGAVTAHGDDAGQDSASGAGGRIALHFDPSSQQALPRPAVRFDASGGNHINGQTRGEVGTIYLTDGQVIPSQLNNWNAQLYGPTNWFWSDVTMNTSAIRMGGPYDVSSFTLDVAGSLTMKTNSTLVLYSGPTNATTWTNYGARLSVSNDWVIGSNGWVWCFSDSTNGGSLLFEASNLTIQATAGISASSNGFKVGYGPGMTLTATRTGGGYGGYGQYWSATRGGLTYGSSNAPTDPGSPGQNGKGGGLIRVSAMGTVANHGSLTANGQTVGNDQGAGAGGGVFIQCRRWEGALGASVQARGGGAGLSNGRSGGGGRIAIWRAEDAYYGSYDVTCGTAQAVAPYATPGTLVLSNVTVAGYHMLTISGQPANRGSPAPQPYGGSLVAEGTWVTNSVSHGADEANGIHYDGLGWDLTNSAGVVSNGASTEAVFPMTTNLWLTWNWTTAYYLAVSPATNGTLSVDRTGWYTNGTMVTFQAVPDAGYSFLQWSGDVPAGGASSNPLTVTMDQPRTIIAHFSANTPESKAWTGTGDWFANYTNWSPGGAPGQQDAVTIASGQPTLRDSITIRTFTVSGGTGVVQQGVNPVIVAVTESVVVSNNGAALTLNKVNLTCGGLRLVNRGILTVYPNPTNAAFSSTGLLVQVNGPLYVGSNSWVYPHSDSTNGGSVCFQASSLTVEGTNGGFDASAKGFAVGYGPGRGGNGRPGGAYGGFGGGQTLANMSTYGSSNAPVDCGSPGEMGRGGGLIRVFVTGAMTINGVMRADGQSFTSGYAGPGSGGGIHLQCRKFVGGANAVVSARGGSGGGNDCGGGGGGRIAVWSSDCTFSGQVSVTNGPTFMNHTVWGTPGTIVWMLTSAPGTLIMVK